MKTKTVLSEALTEQLTRGITASTKMLAKISEDRARTNDLYSKAFEAKRVSEEIILLAKVEVGQYVLSASKTKDVRVIQDLIKLLENYRDCRMGELLTTGVELQIVAAQLHATHDILWYLKNEAARGE